jgi:hypothetical protein
MRRLQVLTISILAIQAVVTLDSSTCFAEDASDKTQAPHQVQLGRLGAGRSPASAFQTVQTKDANPANKQVEIKSMFYATGRNDTNFTLLSKTDKSYITVQHPVCETNFNVLVFALPDHQQFFQQGGLGIAYAF